MACLAGATVPAAPGTPIARPRSMRNATPTLVGQVLDETHGAPCSGIGHRFIIQTETAAMRRARPLDVK
jgi:hypothetical protein